MPFFIHVGLNIWPYRVSPFVHRLGSISQVDFSAYWWYPECKTAMCKGDRGLKLRICSFMSLFLHIFNSKFWGSYVYIYIYIYVTSSADIVGLQAAEVLADSVDLKMNKCIKEKQHFLHFLTPKLNKKMNNNFIFLYIYNPYNKE